VCSSDLNVQGTQGCVSDGFEREYFIAIHNIRVSNYIK